MGPAILAFWALALCVTTAGARTVTPAPTPDPHSVCVVFTPGAWLEAGAPGSVSIAGPDALHPRQSHDPATSAVVTEIRDGHERLLAIASIEPPAGGTTGALGLAVSAAGGARIATEAATRIVAPPGVLPSSTMTWKDSDGSTTVISAYGDVAIELGTGASATTASAAPHTASSNPRVHFALHVAGPNPCTDETAFRFGLPEDGRVTLTIFDAAGRRASNVLNESRAAGMYTVPYRADRLPPGRYFARLSFTRASGALERTATCSLVRLR